MQPGTVYRGEERTRNILRRQEVVLQLEGRARVNLGPFVLYGCESWFLTLREEHRLGVFVNRALRRMFGPKTVEVS